MTLFYRAVRAATSWLLRLFYRIEVHDPHQGLAPSGPTIFIGNHPNGLIDPGLIFIASQRQVTFLAKAPLFAMPVLGALLKGMGALPVFRKKDDPTLTDKNSQTLDASAQALVAGGAITIFPEGISHSEPQLQALKTGAARIALAAAAQGASVQVVPVGFTYAEKNRFRSIARLDVGPKLAVSRWASLRTDDPQEPARQLTQAMADALTAVTLNLREWEDLPLLQTAEALYSLKAGDADDRDERLRAFARGMAILRDEQPHRFEELKGQVLSLQRRLKLTTAGSAALTLRYSPGQVALFVARNLLALALAPLFIFGMALFVMPYWLPALAVRLTKPDEDTEGTVKVLTSVVVAPLWALLLTGLSWWAFGPVGALTAAAMVLPLALFTVYFFERRRQAWLNARTFFVLGSRARLLGRLRAEATALADAIDALVGELKPRVT